MILLIDNYDSFSYNLYQLIGSVNPDVQVEETMRFPLRRLKRSHRKPSCFPRDREDRRMQESVFL